MAGKKNAAPKGGKKTEKKVEEAPVVGAPEAAPEEEVKGAKEAGASKDFATIQATGKFVVVEVEEGRFRMYNERGQAVSAIVSREDTLPNGKPMLTKLMRDASRANALNKQREIRTPRGHEGER